MADYLSTPPPTDSGIVCLDQRLFSDSELGPHTAKSPDYGAFMVRLWRFSVSISDPEFTRKLHLTQKDSEVQSEFVMPVIYLGF